MSVRQLAVGACRRKSAPPPLAVEHGAGERVELLRLQEPPSNAAPQLWSAHIVEDVLRLEQPAQLAERAVEVVAAPEGDDALHGHRRRRVAGRERAEEAPDLGDLREYMLPETGFAIKGHLNLLSRYS